jgi:glucuronate isomerase
LKEERFFSPEPGVRKISIDLYQKVRDYPILSPHGHVEAQLFAENKPFPDPARLIIIPDHYVFRMLYSQGIDLLEMGVPAIDGSVAEKDSRKIWQKFADHFYLFAGTPTGLWLDHELREVFGIRKKLNGSNAMEIYETIQSRLKQPDYLPRALFEKFKIEVLSTTNGASDPLTDHQKIKLSGWNGRIIPCFRPDDVTNLNTRNWHENIKKLSEITSVEINRYSSFITALEEQRRRFKTMGATSTDHGVDDAYTYELTGREAESIFQRALKGKLESGDAGKFTAHMLMEMARMSIDDGLVMQLHPGSFRNHNQLIFQRFGPDKGADIPVRIEFTRNLHALLNKYGNNKDFTFIVFTLDESTYARELAPLAGHYPAMRLGPSWWFFDSIQGMIYHRQKIFETANVYNTVGFIDDTRAYPSIPARHDLSRRVDCDYLAQLVARDIIDMEDAEKMARALAYDLTKKTYKL